MVKVVHQGLGPIGRETARLFLEDPEIEIVGAVDIKEEYLGNDLGDLLKIGTRGIKVTSDAEALLRRAKPDVLVLTTTSSLESILESLNLAIKYGVNVVSPAEELIYPEFANRKTAEDIDRAAKEQKVRILGRGVNPGCLMDLYPLQVYQQFGLDHLESMKVYRWDNTKERRLPLLRKTGTGLTKDEFSEVKDREGFGHAGLPLSAAYLADNIGLDNYEIKFSREPMIAKEAVKPRNMEEIRADHVAGLNETCTVLVDRQPRITLDLRMYVGAKNKNRVEIRERKGHSECHIIDDYSYIVNGDVATRFILREAVEKVLQAPPGLNTTDYVPNPHTLLKKK